MFFIHNNGQSAWNITHIIGLIRDDTGGGKVLVTGHQEPFNLDRDEYDRLVRFLQGK